MEECSQVSMESTAQLFKETEILEGMMLKPDEKVWHYKPLKEPRQVDTVLYLGYGVLRTPHLAQTAVSILESLGENFVALAGPAFCCGIPFEYFDGKKEAARRVGERSASQYRRFNPKQVVMWCPSCVHYYVAIDLEESFKIVHLSEFLAANSHRLRFKLHFPTKVALHYHSGSPEVDGQAKCARTVLEAVPGVELVEIGTSDAFGRACAGMLRDQMGREAWDDLCTGFIQKAVDAGANVFATSYHGCHRMFTSYQDRYPLPIEHYLTFVARAMGIEYRDKYKDYILWGDRKKIMEDASLCLRANGIDEESSSPLIDKYFIRKSGF